jgi:hypothetical protein
MIDVGFAVLRPRSVRDLGRYDTPDSTSIMAAAPQTPRRSCRSTANYTSIMEAHDHESAPTSNQTPNRANTAAAAARTARSGSRLPDDDGQCRRSNHAGGHAEPRFRASRSATPA